MPGGGPGQCDDNDDCTFDLCNPQNDSCIHIPNPNCCMRDADCNDGTRARLDSCGPDHECRNSGSHELLQLRLRVPRR